MLQLKELLQAVEDITRSTGDFILKERNSVSAEEVELKSLNSLVSYVDKTAEKMIVDGVKPLISEAGFIAEEDTESIRGKRYNWVIDPLDGTTNFLHNLPVFAISIALMDGDEVVLGVVYELGQKEMFSATKGGGASLNGKPIQVKKTAELKDTLLATGFPYYDFDRMKSFLNLLSQLFTKTRGVRRLGSAATDLAYVACGRFDGFFEYGLSPWDVAAGALLVTEAGGKVTDYSKGDNFLFGGEILACSSAMFDELYTEVSEHMQGDS
ncbi:inositol monophosphatase family protein [Owenweeksia hongkongensis]|nr:inositol monophosphatase family protein [Owenweeksia hongkongensis]